jgi:hypothetical protein
LERGRAKKPSFIFFWDIFAALPIFHRDSPSSSGAVVPGTKLELEVGVQTVFEIAFREKALLDLTHPDRYSLITSQSFSERF